MKKFFASLVLMTAVLSGRHVQSAVVMSVDLNPGLAGIQNSIEVGTGGSVFADIVLSLTESTSLSAYQFSVQFDQSELQFVSRSEIAPAGFGFVETDTTNTNNLAIGQLFRFGADTGAGPVAPAGPFVVASLQFTALTPTGIVGDSDITALRLAAQGDDFLVNGTFVTIPDNQLFFNSASVSAAAIPEPAGFGLLCMAGLGMIFRRRKSG